MSAAAVNWVIVVVYFGFTLWLGGRVRGSQATLDDYLLAGRRVPWWAASLSIVATETSTLTFVGVPAIAYGGDLTFIQVAFGYVVGRAVVAVTLVPGYFRGAIRTAYEVLAERFGSRVQTLASGVFVVSRCLADGVRLYSTALVLLALVPVELARRGFNEGDPLGLAAAIAVVAGVTLYYTLRGGLRAVIWNDVVQQVVYVGGAAAAAWVLLGRIPGGWSGATTMLQEAGKLRWFDPTLSLSVPYTFWGGLVGGAVLTAATHGTDQMFVQRLLACGEAPRARKALVASGLIVCAQMAFFLWVGALLWAFYTTYPPALPFDAADAVFPRFIAEELPVGLGGLVIAGVFAAAMSTLSSSLNSLASASTVDFARRRPQRRVGAPAAAGSPGSGVRPDRGADAGPDKGLDTGTGAEAGTDAGAGTDAEAGMDAGAGTRAAAGSDTDAETVRDLARSHRMTVVWALALAVVAFLARAWGSVLEAGLTITSVTFGGVLGIFIVGQTRWRLGEGAASAAMASGIVTLVAVHLVGDIAWTWYTLIGAAVTVVVAALLAAVGGTRGGREGSSFRGPEV